MSEVGSEQRVGGSREGVGRRGGGKEEVGGKEGGQEGWNGWRYRWND